MRCCVLYAFIGAWNGFLAPLVFLTDDARYPISLKLFSLVGNIASGTPRWNLFAAGSLLNLALVAALTALPRRRRGDRAADRGGYLQPGTAAAWLPGTC